LKRLFLLSSHVSNHKNDLLSLHPAALAGSILGARPQAHAVAEDAEPETAERRENLAASPAPTGSAAGRPPAPKAGRA